jgi:hypothetical protein
MGIKTSNVTAAVEETKANSRKQYHLSEADRHKAAANSVFVAAELTKSNGDFEEERHQRMLRNSALQNEQRERSVVNFQPGGAHYKAPGEGTTTFIGMNDRHGNPWEISMRREHGQDTAKTNHEISRCQRSG